MAHPHRYRLGSDEKSIEGSVTMFVTSLLFVSLILPVTAVRDGIDLAYTTALWYGLVTAVMATALEALSSQGSDNLTAPLGSALVIHFLLSHAAPENIRFTVGLGLAALVAFLSFKARFLTADGSVATFILATVIFGIGGWSWSIPILAFFVLSSLLSKLGKNKKKRFGTVFEKTSRRDAGQVLANGGVAGIVLVLFNFFPSPYWYHLYLGALAAVNADTWATEAGVLSKIQPRSIAGFRRVSPGTSGGMTPLGTAAALLGAFVIALCGLAAPAYFIFTLGSPAFWIVIAGGFIGGLVDSVLGATLQAQYRCGVCSKITEKRSHCKEKSTRISGLRWMSNDWVNTFCSIGGAGFVWMARNLIRA